MEKAYTIVQHVIEMAWPKVKKVLWRSSEFAVNFYVALKNGGGRVSIRQVTGITHSDLVSGGDGTNPNSANIDAEIIAWFNGN